MKRQERKELSGRMSSSLALGLCRRNRAMSVSGQEQNGTQTVRKVTLTRATGRATTLKGQGLPGETQASISLLASMTAKSERSLIN